MNAAIIISATGAFGALVGVFLALRRAPSEEASAGIAALSSSISGMKTLTDEYARALDACKQERERVEQERDEAQQRIQQLQDRERMLEAALHRLGGDVP